MTPNWTPILGSFEVTEDKIVFQPDVPPLDEDGDAGPPAEVEADGVGDGNEAAAAKPATKPNTVGIIVSDHYAGDGTFSADIEFNGDPDEHTACELILHYDAETQSQLVAGLGGTWASYSIRDWIGPQSPGAQGRWESLALRGQRSNLKEGKTYHVEATRIGSRVTLKVDGVKVAQALVLRPLPQDGQMGLFVLGNHFTTVRNIKMSTVDATAFIVMQFSTPFNEIYADVIKDACRDHHLTPVRADEVYGPGMIVSDIVEQIDSAQVVIAEVTPANQNVYFEVGYAYGVHKPTVLLAEKGTKLPFDLAGFRTLFYENTIAGRAQFDEGLRRHLKSIVGEGK